MVKLSCTALAFLFLAAACGDDDGDDTDGGDGDGVDAGDGVERRLVLFHTNDEHSHLFGFAPEVDDFPLPDEPGDGDIVGNIARRAELLRVERAALDESEIDSLTVSAGDQTQGALPQIAFATTSPDFTLMGQLGYDVMCPGNHEFDLGPDAFAASLEAAAAADSLPAVVSTNIRFSDAEGDDTLEALYGDPGSDSLIAPYHVVTTASGIKVGFVGIMGVSAAFFAPNKAPVEFSGDLVDEGDREAILPRLYEDIQPAVDALRNDEQVDVVVALSHSGVDTTTPELGDDHNIAQNVSGIDIIVSGHSHTALERPMTAEGPDGHVVPIVQAGSYGRFLGRVELVLRDGERPALDDDEERTRLLLVDDTIVPTDEAIIGQLEQIIADVEADALPEELTRIEGVEVVDDPEVLGDLFYRPMGSTEFDVIGLRSATETNMLNMSTDAMLTTADELLDGTEPTLVAVQASGVVRDDIKVGETGILSYADLYRIFPLGENPFDGTIGLPLTRFYIFSVELKAAFELGVSRGYIDGSLFLSGSGIRIEYDTDRPAQVLESLPDALDPENGRITRILIDVDHSDGFDNPTVVLFDLANEGAEFDNGLGEDGAFQLVPVVTSLYIASFADSAGVTLKDEAGQPIAIEDTFLLREDGSDVKDHEAFIAYILRITEENGGTLPSLYDEESKAGALPRRLICTGALCR